MVPYLPPPPLPIGLAPLHQTWLRAGHAHYVAGPRLGRWADIEVGDELDVKGADPPLRLQAVEVVNMLDYGMAWNEYGKRLLPEGVSTPQEAQAHYRSLGPKYADEKVDRDGIVVVGVRARQ